MKKIYSITISLFITTIIFAQAGTFDDSFSEDGFAMFDIDSGWDYASDVLIQADGKILMGGTTAVNGINQVYVMRTDANGAADGTFGIGGLTTVEIDSLYYEEKCFSIVTDNAGKIYASGRAYSSSEAKFFVVRFNADGIIDETFGINGVAKTPVLNSNAYSGKIVLLPDGKILIGCAARSPGGSADRLTFIRFTSNGVIDSTLSGDGIIYPSFVSPFDYLPRDLIVQPDGKIIVAGTRYYSAFFVRFNTNYKIDSTFGNDGFLIGDYYDPLDSVYNIQALSLLEDGKILAIAITSDLSKNVGIYRLNPDGSFDETFSSNGYFEIDYSSGDDIASNIIVQPDGKYIISAVSDPIVAYDFRWMLIRLNADGTLDESFGSGGIKTLGFKDISGLGDGGGYEIFSGLAIAPDGNLMAALSDFDDYTKRDIALSKFILNDIPCENAPTGLFATNTTTNKSKLHWSADPDAIKYKLQYRPYASLIWVSLNAPNNLKIITGLLANTTYEYRVRSLCSTGLLSPWSSIEEFTTLPLRENEIISEGKIEISIYPNPNSGAFILQISELIEEEIIYINIKNMLGEEIYSEHINTSQSTHQINLNKNITSGIYLVELKTDDKIYSQQIIISN